MLDKKKKTNGLIKANFSWDQYFITMAYLVSMKSKDPSTKVGAVIVGSDNEVRMTGYNGLPRNISDLFERYANKEFKNLAVNHAEENAIIQCARVGISSKGCTMYVPWIPCAKCSKSIIQAGIIKVIYDANFPGNKRENQKNWEYSISISLEILKEAGIEIRAFNGKLLQIEGLYQAEFFPLFEE